MDNEDGKCDGTTTEKRIRKPPSWHDDYDMGITALNAQAYVEEIPNTIDQLDGRSDREFWLEAVKTELAAHQKNGIWELVEPPENRKIIDCKWVFKIKRDEEGNVERYKARLVAKGCAQQQGFDYDIVYSPVTRMSTVRLLLTKLELTVVVWAVALRIFLININFTIATDCQPLVYLNTMNTKNSQIIRWRNLLDEFDISIKHRPGEQLPHIDALTRAPIEEDDFDEDELIT
ncbi:form3 [Trypoxylus dichotomus]